MQDLTNAHDHPLKVLAKNWEDLSEEERRSVVYSQNVLDDYEEGHNVTFVALDNDTLGDLVDAYNGGEIEELEAFIRITRDLLGLDDD